MHLPARGTLTRRALARAERAARFAASPGADRPVLEADLDGLPPVVQRYMRAMGVVGRPPVWSLRARFAGRFRMRPGQAWMPAVAWQYNRTTPIARLFRMRIDFAGLVPMLGGDTYVEGTGRMAGRLLGVIPVARAEGPELDGGELVTWLNDAVLLAPSMLLGADVEWAQTGPASFTVTLSDGGRRVTGQVELGDDDRPRDFSTNDRYADLPGGLVQAEWTTPVDGWTMVEGRPRPTGGRAVWHLPTSLGGTFPYVEWSFTSVDYDVAPAPPGRGRRLGHEAGGAAQVLGAIVGAPFLHRRFASWGATSDECRAPMPGDDLVVGPRLQSTRAVTIDAPPEAVWPWLVQIGHGRGGLYSYDGLENLVGCDIHSADRILQEHQDLRAGDVVRLGPEGYPAFRVVESAPPNALVLAAQAPAGDGDGPAPAASSWQWELRPAGGGRSTRLLVRQRTAYPRRQAPLWRLVEPVSFVMEKQMLRGLKARAEAEPRTPHPAPATPRT